MDYFNVEQCEHVSPSSVQRHSRNVTRELTLTFLFVCFSAFLICYALLVKHSLPPTVSESSSENSSAGQLRRMATSVSEDHHISLTRDFDRSLRGFVLAWNQARGFLLLKSDKKPAKGTHYQLPGGHAEPALDRRVAASTPEAAGATAEKKSSSVGVETGVGAPAAALFREDVARIAAARELWEEASIDVRDDIQQLVPLSGLGVGPLKHNRYYFFLNLTDSLLKKSVRDAPTGAGEFTHSTATSRTAAAASAHTGVPQHSEVPAPGNSRSSTKQEETSGQDASASLDAALPQRALMREETAATPGSTSEGVSPTDVPAPVELMIGTAEHCGFRFEPNPEVAAQMVEKHSGGCSSAALRLFYRAVVSTATDALVAQGIPVTFK